MIKWSLELTRIWTSASEFRIPHRSSTIIPRTHEKMYRMEASQQTRDVLKKLLRLSLECLKDVFCTLWMSERHLLYVVDVWKTSLWISERRRCGSLKDVFCTCYRYLMNIIYSLECHLSFNIIKYFFFHFIEFVNMLKGGIWMTPKEQIKRQRITLFVLAKTTKRNNWKTSKKKHWKCGKIE